MLEKPKNEECGNCYYCTSYMSTEQRRGKGFLAGMENYEVENFECRRYPVPPSQFIKKSGMSVKEWDIFHTIRKTTKLEWCGEWQSREKGIYVTKN